MRGHRGLSQAKVCGQIHHPMLPQRQVLHNCQTRRITKTAEHTCRGRQGRRLGKGDRRPRPLHGLMYRHAPMIAGPLDVDTTRSTVRGALALDLRPGLGSSWSPTDETPVAGGVFDGPNRRPGNAVPAGFCRTAKVITTTPRYQAEGS